MVTPNDLFNIATGAVYKDFITSDDGYFVLHSQDNWDYEILHSEVSTPQKLVTWISHLLEKNWVEKEHVQGLVYLAQRVHGHKV